MVELTLENVETNGMPVDCFVSVRVGDAQRLSRLSAARVFRFPDAGDRRHGRIEVFRRIGSCNVDVDPTRKGFRDVSVNCCEAGFGSLGLKLAIGGESAKQKQIGEVDCKKTVGAKEQAAREYLAKCGLELQLSEAMQALLREKPEDPAEYLASRLMMRAGPQGGKLPPMATTSTAATGLGTDGVEWRKPVDAQFQGSAAKKAPQKLEPLGASQPMPISVQSRDLFAQPVPSPRGPRVVEAVSIVPFAAYHQSHFRKIDRVAWQQLYARFPKSQPSSKICGADFYRTNVTPVTTPANPHAAQKHTCISMPDEKFPAHSPAFAKSVPAVSAVAAWKKNPSVGTWLSCNRKLKTSSRSWHFSPSVGSWLSPWWPEDANKQPKQTLSPRGSVGTWPMHVDKESGQSESPPPEQTRGSASNGGGPNLAFKLAPSVGSWIAPPAHLRMNTLTKDSPSGCGAVQPQMCFRPSVGTWLVPRIDA